jgi:glycosyltransferase involved in cell wall biosynthesis
VAGTTEALFAQIPPSEKEDSFALTVIVDADPRGREPADSIRAIQAAVAGVDAQIILTCQEPLSDVPDGVEVVVFPSAGQGDRYDAAARVSRSPLLAFVGSGVVFSAGWASEVARLFEEDPTLTVAGGPVVPQGERRTQRVSALVMTHYLGGTPAAHNARLVPARRVREVGLSNLIIRASAFQAVGGFQAPAGGHGEAVRLCYKVRTLLDGKIMSHPGLAVKAPAPRFPGPLLHDIATYGRSRGDMARRLPEAAPLFPYALPSLISVLFCVSVGLLFVAGRGVVRAALLAAIAALILFFFVQSARTLRESGSLVGRLLAGFALPIVLFIYGVSFIRGYFGRSMEDISPPRERTAPLRVLILNWRDVTHPWSGGAETYIHQLARRWAADGMDVGWLTQRHAGSARSEVIDRIRIHRIGGPVTQYAWVGMAYLIRFRRRYDVIVDCENGIPFFSPLFSRLPKVLVVHHVHQEIFRQQLPRQLRWFALWLEGWLMPRLYRNAQVVAVSEGTRTDLVALGFDSDRISVITNGVVPPESVAYPRSLRPTILCMGRLKPQKSVDVLIRSLPAILERIPDLHVDIVGQGPDRNRLERLAWSTGLAGHVHFHGYVSAKVRDELAAAAWVAVCPSSFEGWGVVCMEASARGLPVVASNVAGLRESVRDGETGVLFPYGDVRALADTVVSLLQDPEVRSRMGVVGKEWAARHTWDGSASVFGGLLTSQVRPRSTTRSGAVAAFASWR